MSTWTRTSEERFQQLVDFMTPRIKAVLEEKGGPARFWRGGAGEEARGSRWSLLGPHINADPGIYLNE